MSDDNEFSSNYVGELYATFNQARFSTTGRTTVVDLLPNDTFVSRTPDGDKMPTWVAFEGYTFSPDKMIEFLQKTLRENRECRMMISVMNSEQLDYLAALTLHWKRSVKTEDSGVVHESYYWPRDDPLTQSLFPITETVLSLDSKAARETRLDMMSALLQQMRD